jgi:hypothetical protein
MTKIMYLVFINLVTLKVRAKHELLFNKPASEASLLNKSSYLAPALGVTKFPFAKDMILFALCCVKSDFDVQQTQL